jgi:hypothetical protein
MPTVAGIGSRPRSCLKEWFMIAETIARRSRIALLALLCLGPAGAVFGQQVTPSALATARELLQVKGATNMFDPLIAGIVESAKNNLLPMNPALFKELTEVAALLSKEFGPRRAEVIDEIARLYAQRFTEAELKQVIAFYKTPVGKKFVTDEPAIIDQGLTRAQAWSQKLSEEILGRFRVEMRKRGHDL